MNLTELLDNLRTSILHDTSDAVDGDSDQLWSDKQLVGFIHQAQRRFARRSLCIRDGSSPITRVSLVGGQSDYQLDPSILAVMSVRMLGNATVVDDVLVSSIPDVQVIPPDRGDLSRTGHGTRPAFGDRNGYGWDPSPDYGHRAGKPLFYETDEDMGETTDGSAGVVTLHLTPTPASIYTGSKLGLRVARAPLLALTPANMDAVPEIPEDYHVDMLDYAAYLALRVVDHEAGDPARAQDFLQAFEAHAKEAKLEIERKTFVPLAWAFGGGIGGYAPN